MTATKMNERPRAMLRIGMGMLQVFAATVALVLLLRTGVSRASIGAAILSLALTLTSKALFHEDQTENGVAHDDR